MDESLQWNGKSCTNTNFCQIINQVSPIWTHKHRPAYQYRSGSRYIFAETFKSTSILLQMFCGIVSQQ